MLYFVLQNVQRPSPTNRRELGTNRSNPANNWIVMSFQPLVLSCLVLSCLVKTNKLDLSLRDVQLSCLSHESLVGKEVVKKIFLCMSGWILVSSLKSVVVINLSFFPSKTSKFSHNSIFVILRTPTVLITQKSSARN